MKTIALNIEVKQRLVQEEKKSLNIKCKPNRFRHKSDANKKKSRKKHMRKLAKKRFWFVLIIHPDTWVPY